jgi:hypothetical protein
MSDVIGRGSSLDDALKDAHQKLAEPSGSDDIKHSEVTSFGLDTGGLTNGLQFWVKVGTVTS